ncbi:MAG: 16S rRNA (uracil(1498)-N(3))-methyltransferase [Crocinitomicaceae bacterium]|nr:16S rRNA (uracil(1498)-N(3))-methyltransferase [Crocinitomicaceae bacterium]
MRLFYDPNIAANANSHILSEEESKHIVRVLRMNAGDKLVLLNGKGYEFICSITDAHAKRCTIEITEQRQSPAPSSSIHIAVSPTKQMERIEWFVEKATEIGVTEITFLKCDNSERVKLKLDRLERKAISAMKQSHRTYLPKLNDLTSTEEFIKNHPNGLIAHCYEGEKLSIPNSFSNNDCPILIGPEGDFSETEVELAAKNGYKIVTLGENRLRTETAALYACMQAKLITG